MGNIELEAEVREEVDALHRFFVGWFTGALPDTDEIFQRDFLARFDDDFLLIPPAGVILAVSMLGGGFRAEHGKNPDFRIAIRETRVRRIMGDLVLATYEEWQRNAVESSPPDNGRVSSVLFRREQGLRWLHVHETWLPADRMNAGPYDF